jgi:hypothetical protein
MRRIALTANVMSNQTAMYRPPSLKYVSLSTVHDEMEEQCSRGKVRVKRSRRILADSGAAAGLDVSAPPIYK